MRAFLCGAMLMTVLGLTGCQTSESPKAHDLNLSQVSLIQSSNQFGFKLFKESVAQGDGDNEFVSPLSVSVAFGMLQNGAVGNTLEEIKTALSLAGLSQQDINLGYYNLIALLTSIDPKVTMEIADSIWYRQGFPVLDPFVDVNQTYFDASVRELDFNDQETSLAAINGWVADKTHDKIKGILNEISPDAMMYLMNAIYFKGTWTIQFDQKNTRDHFFQVGDTQKPIKIMSLHENFPYLETEDFQAVDLAYGDGLFRMALFLPKEGKSIDTFIASMNDENWQTWMAGLQVQEMDLALPRFELERDYTLNQILQVLGMRDVFSGAADLSGIDGARDLFVSTVKHKTYVKVNEEGTEAAAVTSIGIGGVSVPAYKAMVLDRPFVFVIHEDMSNSLLFMGKIVNPQSE